MDFTALNEALGVLVQEMEKLKRPYVDGNRKERSLLLLGEVVGVVGEAVEWRVPNGMMGILPWVEGIGMDVVELIEGWLFGGDLGMRDVFQLFMHSFTYCFGVV